MSRDESLVRHLAREVMGWALPPRPVAERFSAPFNPLTNLADAFECQAALGEEYQMVFAMHLMRLVDPTGEAIRSLRRISWAVATATARQRAEAIALATGWEWEGA